MCEHARGSNIPERLRRRLAARQAWLAFPSACTAHHAWRLPGRGGFRAEGLVRLSCRRSGAASKLCCSSSSGLREAAVAGSPQHATTTCTPWTPSMPTHRPSLDALHAHPPPLRFLLGCLARPSFPACRAATNCFGTLVGLLPLAQVRPGGGVGAAPSWQDRRICPDDACDVWPLPIPSI